MRESACIASTIQRDMIFPVMDLSWEKDNRVDKQFFTFFLTDCEENWPLFKKTTALFYLCTISL